MRKWDKVRSTTTIATPAWISFGELTAPMLDPELHTCVTQWFYSCTEENKAHASRNLNVCVYSPVQPGPAWAGLATDLCRVAEWTRRGRGLREGRGCSNLLISLIPRLWVPCQQDAGNKGRGKQLMTRAAVHSTMPTHINTHTRSCIRYTLTCTHTKSGCVQLPPGNSP